METVDQLGNNVNRVLKSAKKEYLRKRLNRKIENAKFIWDGVKDFLGWKSKL